MKTTTLLLYLFCVSTLAFSQTQRVELYENFTGEDCPAAPAADSTVHLLINANPGKIVAIAYETRLPNRPPGGSLYSQDSRDIRNRVSYYGITLVPYARFDGKTLADPANATLNGLSTLLTQNTIDTTAANVNAPFTVKMSHTFNTTYDSVTVQMVITATEALTFTGTLKAQIAMEEAKIKLPAPSGSNRQTTFYNVCRLMLPPDTANGGPSLGTTLPAVWASGQTQTLSYKVLVPTSIYDKGQICFAGFVQDSTTFVVEQAGIDVIQPIPNDASLTYLKPFPFLLCNTDSVTPVATLYDRGADTLHNCILTDFINTGGLLQSTWTGTLAPGDSTTVSLRKLGVVTGLNTLTVGVVSPNGVYAVNSSNTTQTQSFNIDSTAVMAPMVQPFNPVSGYPNFPPHGWLIDNPSNNTTWAASNNVGDLALGCARMNFANSPPGDIEYLYCINVNLSAGNTAVIFFDVAYSPYPGYPDSLVIQASDNCAATWTTVYSKGPNDLATAPLDTTTNFTPSAAQWRHDVVNLNAFAGQDNVLVRFKAISGGGNNLYIDDVNISNSALGIKENTLSATVNVHPNPFSTSTLIDFNLSQGQDVVFKVYNLLGREVFASPPSSFPAGENTLGFRASTLADGVYFLQLNTTEGTTSQKIVISR